MIDITEKAQAEIVRIFKTDNPGEGSGLRLAVTGGGCSGLSYKIDFDIQKPHDNIIDFPDFKVFIDHKSSIYLKGITLDFKDGLGGKGFVFENPNAQNTCGCGESFSI
jgi:iron-sulfur cluster assembly protein